MTLPYEYTGHDCTAPLGVVVHQHDGPPVRLPIVDDGLQLHERKVGPTAITRRAEVTIPIEDNAGNNWVQYVNAFDPTDAEQDRLAGPTSSTGIPVDDPVPTEPLIQIADVIGQPIDDDGNPVGDPTVLFRGYTAAVGSTEGTNRARFRIHDPKDFLSVIEAGVSFKNATPKDVLNYIRDRFGDKQSVFKGVSIAVEDVPERVIRDEFKFAETTRRILNDEPIVGEVITFSTNRDTLVDVLRWLTDSVSSRVWFEPNGYQGITLRAVEDDSQAYDLTPSSANPPRVIANNALYEMRPFNAIQLKGATKKLIDAGPLSVDNPISDTYPEATATYPPLVERFGGELAESETSEKSTSETLEQEAASRLKSNLDDVSGGSMTTTLAPMMRPFDTVQATPACSGVAADISPLQYEIQEATHRIVPSNNNLPQTEIEVSIAVDPSLIETESVVKDTETGEEPTDDPAYEQYEYTTAG